MYDIANLVQTAPVTNFPQNYIKINVEKNNFYLHSNWQYMQVASENINQQQNMIEVTLEQEMTSCRTNNYHNEVV